MIAVNNSRAASEGIAIRQIVVNNRGRSVAATASRSTVVHQEVLPVNVTTTLTSGSVQRVELRHLGRTIGQLAGGSGTVSLDASRLAFGENWIIPVAIFADGEQVSGATFVVSRSPEVFAAQPASNPVDRTAGIRAEYFLNRGAATIAASDFSGTPDIVSLQNSMQLTASDLATSAVDRLGVRFTGRFDVTDNADSEYLISLLGTNDSARLTIDGRPILSFDGQPYGVYGDASAAVFLAPGEHSFELLVSNLNAFDPGLFRVDFRLRGPDGVTRVVDRSNAFATAATPTPNRAPNATTDAYSVTQDQSLDIPAAGVLANDSDPDGNRLTARIATAPQHGTVTLRTDGSFGYAPDHGYVGMDEFTYIANDGQADSSATSVSIDVRTVLPPTPQTPTLSISNVTLIEGHVGTKNADFTVTMSAASTQPVTIHFATANGTAVAGSDYVSASGTLTIPVGSTTGTITVSVTGDTTVETDESFVVTLSNAINAMLANAQGLAAIRNDDVAPTVVPRPPINVAATNGTIANRVRVTWAASANATSYEVWRGPSNNRGTAIKITTLPMTSTSHDDTTVAPGRTYWYWIKAQNNRGTSGFSAADSGRASRSPVNNNFANRIAISGTSAAVMGTNIGATKQLGEPYHGGNSGGKSVWWAWTSPSSGVVQINTSGSNFDTLLGVYTGNSIASLRTVASDDDSGGNFTSQVTFNALRGITYLIAVDGYGGTSGHVKLAISTITR